VEKEWELIREGLGCRVAIILHRGLINVYVELEAPGAPAYPEGLVRAERAEGQVS
jgi:hypothetical protein